MTNSTGGGYKKLSIAHNQVQCNFVLQLCRSVAVIIPKPKFLVGTFFTTRRKVATGKLEIR